MIRSYRLVGRFCLSRLSTISATGLGGPIALTIAGSDSGGGAGVQADLKTFSALGVYGASVITAVTAQNTCAVTDVHQVPTTVITAQMNAVFDDLNVQAVKVGMLGTTDAIEAVAQGLNGHRIPIVLDPVMIAKSGDALLAESAIEALIQHLLPKATVLTPNLPEASRLLGVSVARNRDEMEQQARALLALGPSAVLMKGGHSYDATCSDVLIGRDGTVAFFEASRVSTKNTHGTGCTLSAAIAAGLANGNSLEASVASAHEYLQGAIRSADLLSIGRGHGPVHHFHRLWGRE